MNMFQHCKSKFTIILYEYIFILKNELSIEEELQQLPQSPLPAIQHEIKQHEIKQHYQTYYDNQPQYLDLLYFLNSILEQCKWDIYNTQITYIIFVLNKKNKYNLLTAEYNIIGKMACNLNNKLQNKYKLNFIYYLIISIIIYNGLITSDTSDCITTRKITNDLGFTLNIQIDVYILEHLFREIMSDLELLLYINEYIAYETSFIYKCDYINFNNDIYISLRQKIKCPDNIKKSINNVLNSFIKK